MTPQALAQSGSLPFPSDRAPSWPSWYPAWARELAELYFSGTTCVFLLHGNVHDLVHCPTDATGGEESYSTLAEFLATQVFGSWDVVLHYDLSRGLRPLAGSNAQRLQAMLPHLTPRLGDPGSWPRDPENVLLLLDRFIERNLLETDAASAKASASSSSMPSTWRRPET